MHLLFKYFVICVLDSFLQDTVICRFANSFLEFALQLWKLRRHGDGSTGGSVSLCECLCVRKQRRRSTDHNYERVCVCMRECMCRCSDIRNRIRLKFTTEKITVEVSQRFGREYVSFINSFFFRFKRRFSNFDLRFHFTSRNVITIYCHSQNTQNGYFKSDQIY